MTWVKIDDLLPENEKFLRVSDSAFRCHISALCWSARNLTDGHISDAVLPKLGGTFKDVRELVRAKLWKQQRRRGWLIHDYLEYNPSRTEVLAQRQQKAEAGRKGGQAAAIARATAGATPSGTSPVPNPSRPQPDPQEGYLPPTSSTPLPPAYKHPTPLPNPNHRISFNDFAAERLARWIEDSWSYIGARTLIAEHGVERVLKTVKAMTGFVDIVVDQRTNEAGRVHPVYAQRRMLQSKIKNPDSYLAWAVRQR